MGDLRLLPVVTFEMLGFIAVLPQAVKLTLSRDCITDIDEEFLAPSDAYPLADCKALNVMATRPVTLRCQLSP